MKIWVTRPGSSEVYMGGMRSVQVFLERPVFDHRPLKVEFELFDPKTNAFVAEVYREHGWYTATGSLRGKPFLKQDKSIFDQVWSKIYASVVPASCPNPENYRMSDEEYRKLLNEGYEMDCRKHWKRFLLEVDIGAGTALEIEPEVIISEKAPTRHYPITDNTGRTSLFLKGDLEMPYFPNEHRHLETRPGQSW